MAPPGINDPALVEELRTGAGDEELPVIVRLSDPDALPPGARIVTRFGDIATVRIARARLQELAESGTVTGLEASRNLRPSHETEDGWEDDGAIDEGDDPDEGGDSEEPTPYTRRPDGVKSTGKNVLVAALDWGIDHGHPAFQHADGSTRIVSLWDQRGTESGGPDNRWGYGHIYTSADINRALETDDPYTALNYHPADAGGRGGAHGSHVLDIAAGSGLGGGMPGVAPEADLVFVHLARTTEVLGEGNLGDSASVLEALDHVFTVAGNRPCVVNMSVGAHGGPHDGSTLVELGIDQAVSLAPGRCVVNSAGNYRTKRAHTTGRVTPDAPKTIPFQVPAHDTNDSEIELFYRRVDRFTAEVVDPSGTILARVSPGQNLPMAAGGGVVGHVHHQVRHGTNGDHHIDILLRPDAPGGVWTLRLIGDTVHDGRYHAWIERDRGLQPTFLEADIVTSSTTGSLCNGHLSLTTGCVDARRLPRQILVPFSSGGPTRDGRVKPELVAPGFRIRAARSAPRGYSPGARYTRKSGTSMAAPHVAGTVALMYEAAGKPLEIYDTRALLFGSVDPSPFFGRPIPGPDLHRFGYGSLDIVAAERAARDFGRQDGAGEEKDAETMAAWEVAEEGPPEAEVAVVAASEAGAPLPELSNGGNVTESTRRSDALQEDLGSIGWIQGPEELQQLAFHSLGVERAMLVPVSDPAGGLLTHVEPGDLLVRSAPVAGGRYTAVVVSEHPESRWSLLERGVPVEPGGPGWFVQVIEVPPGGGAPHTIGRRLTDASGRVPRYQTVLRPGTPEGSALAAEDGAGAETSTTLVEWPDLPRGATLDRSARLEWEDLTRIADSKGGQQLFVVVTGAPRDAAKAGDEGKAIFHLRVYNTNSVYNHQDVFTQHKLYRGDKGRRFLEVTPWIRTPGRELEDESSRVIRVPIKPDDLVAAYNLEPTAAWAANSPLARLEVEYHWREAGEGTQLHFNNKGLDFMLVAPVEYLFEKQTPLTPHEIALDDYEKYGDDFWIPFPGVEFTPELRDPITFQLEISSSVRKETTVEKTVKTGTTTTVTRTQTVSNTFSASLSGEASQGGSAKLSIEVAELALQKMFKLGGTFGYSRTSTDTNSTAVARELSTSLRMSRTYAITQGVATRTTVTISPPKTPSRTQTGPKSGGSSGGAADRVGVYVYPVVVYYDVPIVKFSNVNRFGQATRRIEDSVPVPFVKRWILTTRRG